MPVPIDAIAFWPASYATIPANWSQSATGISSYLQGALGEAGGSGGSGTHLHTSTHTHGIIAHTHSLKIANAASVNTGILTSFKGTTIANRDHTHNTGNTVAAVFTQVSAAVSTSSVTTGALPSTRDVVMIEPDDGNQELPQSVVALTDRISAPEKWSLADGTGGTVNFEDRFILGVAALADGGGTRGTTTHNHSMIHNHTLNSHTHADSVSGTAIQTSIVTATRTGNSVINFDSHHTYTSIGSTVSTVLNWTPTVISESNEPAFIKLLAIQNTTGADTPAGVILPYTGTIASLGSIDFWYYCDGVKGGVPDLRSKQIKCTVTGGEVLDTGGSNTHTHTLLNHAHNGVSHAHTSTFGNQNAVIATASINSVSASTHTHSGTRMGTTNANLGFLVVVTDATDIRHPYDEVIFIKYVPPTVWIKGAKMLGNTAVL